MTSVAPSSGPRFICVEASLTCSHDDGYSLVRSAVQTHLADCAVLSAPIGAKTADRADPNGNSASLQQNNNQPIVQHWYRMSGRSVPKALPAVAVRPSETAPDADTAQCPQPAI